MTLFGTLSPTLTFILKMQTWLEVHTVTIAAGFPPRTNWNNLKRNGRTCRQPLKPNTLNEGRLGCRCNRVNDGDELITEILGKENPYLVSIVGGIGSGDNIQAREHTLDASSGAIEKHSLSSTSSYLPVGPDRMVE